MISDHPEIDDSDLVAQLLERQHNPADSRDGGGRVDVLLANGEEIEWNNGLDEKALKGLLMNLNFTPKSKTSSQQLLRVFFVNKSKTSGMDIGKASLQALQTAGFSNIIVAAACDPDEKWAKMGDTCFMSLEHVPEGSKKRGDAGKAVSFEMCYRYSCGWNNLISYIQYRRCGNTRTYFCVNYPNDARQRLAEVLRGKPQLAYREIFIDALAADESLKAWKIILGNRRRKLVNFEMDRGRTGSIQTKTEQLHILSRDWHILLQDLSDFSAQLKFLRETFTKFKRGFGGDPSLSSAENASDIMESFDLLDSRSDIYRRWVSNYRDRTNIQINLLFHLANQAEARTNTQIAAATAKVAEQTQRDSASMITIASVTMLFLPGTFISAILSTTFFAYDSSGRLSVSSQWWILPTSTVPLTIVVFGVWLAWQRARVRRAKRKQEDAVAELPQSGVMKSEFVGGTEMSRYK